MKKILTILSLLILLAAPCLAGIKPTKNKYHQKLADATFALYGQKGDVHHMLCTATAIQKTATGYKLLTASHCVKGDDLPEDLTFSVAEQAVDDISLTMPVTVDKALRNEKIDYAILNLKTTKKYPVIPLGDESELRIESRVYNVNFSEAIVKQNAMGVVSTDITPNHGADNHCSVCLDRFIVHIFYGAGASGSAVVSEKTHKIVGVLTGGFDDAMGAEIEPISLIIAEMNKP